MSPQICLRKREYFPAGKVINMRTTEAGGKRKKSQVAKVYIMRLMRVELLHMRSKAFSI